jgi:hypothetical protein
MPAARGIGRADNLAARWELVCQREVQEFVFRFLPSLFEDLSLNMEQGLTKAQSDKIYAYFNRIISIVAINYPHRYFIWGSLPYKKLTRLRRSLEEWNGREPGRMDAIARQRQLDKMASQLSVFSRTYKMNTSLNLTERKQKFIIAQFDMLGKSVRGLSNIGLHGVESFARNYTNYPFG